MFWKLHVMTICHLNTYNELQLTLLLIGHWVYLDTALPLHRKMGKQGRTELKNDQSQKLWPRKDKIKMFDQKKHAAFPQSSAAIMEPYLPEPCRTMFHHLHCLEGLLILNLSLPCCNTILFLLALSAQGYREDITPSTLQQLSGTQI